MAEVILPQFRYIFIQLIDNSLQLKTSSFIESCIIVFIVRTGRRQSNIDEQ